MHCCPLCLHILAMASPCRPCHAHTMPPYSLSHLWPTSPCLGDMPHSPEPACTSPGRRGAPQRLERDVPVTPRSCQSAHGHALDTTEHCLTPSTQPSSRPLLSPTRSQGRQLPPDTLPCRREPSSRRHHQRLPPRLRRPATAPDRVRHRLAAP
jgi:hypothetical protein